jgi:hypothetical protein
MFVQIINYHFKGPAEKKQGIEFIKNTIIPHENQKFGFISASIANGGDSELFLLTRYGIKENAIGNQLDLDNFTANFASLWSASPEIVAGTNRISSTFQNKPKKAKL